MQNHLLSNLEFLDNLENILDLNHHSEKASLFTPNGNLINPLSIYGLIYIVYIYTQLQFSNTTHSFSHIYDIHNIIHLWLLLFGSSWTPNSSWCKTHNWVMKPSFGQMHRFSLTDLIASRNVILRFNIKKAITIVEDLLTPDTQWTNTLPTK